MLITNLAEDKTQELGRMGAEPSEPPDGSPAIVTSER
jgi:hypothetical protein